MQWPEFLNQIRHFTPQDQKRIETAFRLSQELHREQKRKSGDPYFIHPLTVATGLIPYGADADTIIAALLHDTVEDTPISTRELEKQFDGDVASLIEGLTKLNAEDVADSPNLNEQIETLRKMFTLMEKDVRIMVIKLVDRLHNMQTAQFLPPARQKALAQETLDVFVKIAERLSIQDLRYELEALSLQILNPQLFSQLEILDRENEAKGQKILPEIQAKIKAAHPDIAKHMEMQFEHKTWGKLRAQYDMRGAPGPTSLVFSFVCPDRDTCYRILGALHESWQREMLAFQDFVNSPLPNGYQAVHTTIILNDGTRVRCKIRTQEMEKYRHRGVTTFCFDADARKNLGSLLPWTKRIPTLTEDTKERSSDFWESLQGDILGETITVHGAQDQTVQLPKGSTALDGIFHLYLERALRVKSLRVNGSEVPFNTPLQNGVSIEARFGRESSVSREWLQWVQTRFTSAMIRNALAGHAESERISSGRAMLQEYLSEQKKGFIEEFDPAEMQQRIHPLGYATLKDVYLALADGRTQASDVYAALFSPKRKSTEQSQITITTIQYTMNLRNVEVMDRLIRTHRRYVSNIQEVRYIQPSSENGTTLLKVSMHPQQLRIFQEELAAAGGKNVRTVLRPSLLKFSAGMVALILLWGLDPVLARVLLSGFHVVPLDLVIVRFWSLTVLSAVLLLWTRMRNPLAEVRLPLRSVSLWISVLLLFCVACTTYLSLATTPAANYTIPMTAAGLLILSIVHRKKWLSVAFTWIFLGVGIALLVIGTPKWKPDAMVATFLAVLAFTAFSFVSERYKREERVDVRAAQYFFVISLGCAILTLPMLPFSSLFSEQPLVILWMVLFSIILAGVPYYLYYYLLTHKEVNFVLRYSYLLIPVTLAGEFLLHESIPKFTLLSAFIVICGALLPLLPKLQTLFTVRHQQLTPRAPDEAVAGI